MHILITGAAGFIGCALALRLAERGERITGLDNLNNYYDVRLKEARLARLTGKPGFDSERSRGVGGARLRAVRRHQVPEGLPSFRVGKSRCTEGRRPATRAATAHHEPRQTEPLHS